MVNNNSPYVIGLTGQTGAGKSAVGEMLRNRAYKVIDADAVSREVVGKGSECLRELALRFGDGILNADGTLNRRALGDIVFGDSEKREIMGNIMFPYIRENIQRKVAEFVQSGESAVFLDAPTLFESGADKECDKIVSVIAPLALRRRRIIERDGLTEEQADSRIAAQHEDEFYTSRSNFIINNNGDKDALAVQVDNMLARLF